MIARGQIFSKTTPDFGKQICLRVTLMDTIIHDLKERKLLIAKDSIYRGQILILSDFSTSNVHSIHPSKDNSLDAKSGSKNAPIKPRTRVIQYIGEIHSCIPLDNVQFHQNLLYYSDISGNILPI